MGIEARASVATRAARHRSAADDGALDSLHFGPLRVYRLRSEELAEIVGGAIETASAPIGVAFCNAHTAETALRDARLAAALRRFLVVNDGIGIELGARIVSGRGFSENLNGTDFIPYLFAGLSRPTRVYLLGGLPGVADAAACNFSARFPNVVVVGCQDGGFTSGEDAAVVAAVRAAAPDILLVGMGNPKQEMFIADNFEALGAPVMIGVGALFDFVSGRIRGRPGRCAGCASNGPSDFGWSRADWRAATRPASPPSSPPRSGYASPLCGGEAPNVRDGVCGEMGQGSRRGLSRAAARALRSRPLAAWRRFR